MNYGKAVHEHYMVSFFTFVSSPWNNNEACSLNKVISYNRMKALGWRGLYFSLQARASTALWSDSAPWWNVRVVERKLHCAQDHWHLKVGKAERDTKRWINSTDHTAKSRVSGVGHAMSIAKREGELEPASRQQSGGVLLSSAGLGANLSSD